MKTVVAVFLAGCIGGLSRVGIESLIGIKQPFPISTLLINVIGALGLGYVTSSFKTRWTAASESMIQSITTGFFGSFTTFSAIISANYSLVISGNISWALLYLALSILLGLFAAWFGYALGEAKP